MIAELATAAPNGYNCAPILALPYKGAEILVIASIFLALLVCFAVSFLDVAAKQLWPSFLDPAVAARLADVQRMFPNLGAAKAPTSGTSAADGDAGVPVKNHTIPHPVTGAPIEYDAVVSPEPYISTKTVDEDLLIILANNEAFSTVSSYCSCTVRGYAMLSVMLTSAALCLSLLWCHNAIVDQRFAGSWVNQFGLLGYCMAVLTAVVMCGPTSNAVHRNANQLLWFSVPLSGPGSKVLSLHGIGIVSFVLLPFLAHLLNALTYKEAMPNYHEILTMSGLILGSGIIFGVAPSMHKCGLGTELQGKKIGILFEIVAVFSAMVSFASYETYGSMSCAGMLANWQKMLLVAFFGPFAFMAVKQYNSITRFVSKPSLLLTFNGTPVATVGPCPVQRYNNIDSAELPHLSEPHMQAVSAQQ